jgi:hypothetical protein
MLPLSPYRIILVLVGSSTNAVVVAGLMLGAAVAAVWFDRNWVTVLLLATVAALFVDAFGDVATGFAFGHGWLQRFGLLDGCMVSPKVTNPLGIIELFSYLLPVALVLWIVRLLRTGLTMRCRHVVRSRIVL